MKVSPSSKNTLQLTHYLSARWHRWVIGVAVGFVLMAASAQTPPATQDSDVMTREQILNLFEREARAAYQIAKETCEPLTGEAQKRCLAQARLQYDADRRYARKRADQGY